MKGSFQIEISKILKLEKGSFVVVGYQSFGTGEIKTTYEM